MVHAGAIAERHLVEIARPSARAVIATLREQRRDHAMLHVEERHGVMDDDLRPRTKADAGGRCADQVEQLRGVEIERRREGGEPAPEHLGGGEPVRHVEREVADGDRAPFIAGDVRVHRW